MHAASTSDESQTRNNWLNTLKGGMPFLMELQEMHKDVNMPNNHWCSQCIAPIGHVTYNVESLSSLYKWRLL